MAVQSSVGQMRPTDDWRDTEEQLKASTKQVNQFFRRFNGEESPEGERYYSNDKEYHSPSLRRKYMPVIFDTETSQLDTKVAENFVRMVTDKKSPQFLDFHQDDWSAEVRATFKYKGRTVSGLLFMNLQQIGQGYEWVIADVAFDCLDKQFKKDTTDQKQFIHPMSHELGFITLRKAFKDNQHNESYTPKNHEIDILSIFIYELNQGNMQFVTVNDLIFHFFAIDGYYFSVSYFNRSGYNSGWLISSLVPLASADEKQQMKNYIYGND